MGYSKQDIEDLYEGKLRWERVKEIMSRPKDDDRFEKSIAVLQDRVAWKERILLPVSEHLYVVQKGDERVVKCECGHEFGDYRRNWKLNSLVFVRDDREKLEEIYPGVKCPDPDVCEVREFYCPDCGTLLKVESVPVGHPVIFDFLPDIDAFYRDWLGQPLSDEKDYRDLSHEVIEEWASRGW
jgi:acetone carboxylase gamma subunit